MRTKVTEKNVAEKVCKKLNKVGTANASNAKKAMPARKVMRTKVTEKNVAERKHKKLLKVGAANASNAKKAVLARKAMRTKVTKKNEEERVHKKLQCSAFPLACTAEMAKKKVVQEKMAHKKVTMKNLSQKKGVQKVAGKKLKKVAKKVAHKTLKKGAQKKVAKQKVKVALYARTSSAANAAGHSTARQLEAATSGLQKAGVQRSSGFKIDKVAEVISGMLPLAERTKLQKLLSGEFDTVIVESQRALARGVHAAEEVYQTAKKNNVNIVVNDMPTLYKLDANPAESFIRRVMAAVCEFERDTIVARLQAGLQAKRATTKRKTQTGQPKVQGRKTLLERSGVLRSSPSARPQLRKLKAATKQHEKGEIGWRPLAQKVQQILELDKVPSIEVVRRMMLDLTPS